MSTEGDTSSESWTEQSFEARLYSDINSPTEQKQISGKSSSFNKRKKILLFTVIVVLVIIIIAMMAVMIAVLKFQYATNETSASSSANPSRATPATTTAVTIYDVGGGGTSGGPPCSSHTVVNDPSRNVGTSGMGGTCDIGPLFNTSIGGRWIRFVGNGGTMLPSYSPGIQHCGAYLVAWSNITLPSTTETVINGTGCIQSPSDLCIYLIHLAVVNCATFYVYFLPPFPVCNTRYCTI